MRLMLGGWGAEQQGVVGRRSQSNIDGPTSASGRVTPRCHWLQGGPTSYGGTLRPGTARLLTCKSPKGPADRLVVSTTPQVPSLRCRVVTCMIKFITTTTRQKQHQRWDFTTIAVVHTVLPSHPLYARPPKHRRPRAALRSILKRDDPEPGFCQFQLRTSHLPYAPSVGPSILDRQPTIGSSSSSCRGMGRGELKNHSHH